MSNQSPHRRTAPGKRKGNNLGSRSSAVGYFSSLRRRHVGLFRPFRRKDSMSASGIRRAFEILT